MLITIAVCAVIGIAVFAILCPTLYAIYNSHIKRENKTRSKAYQIKGNEDIYGALFLASLIVAIVVAVIVGLRGYSQVLTKETYHTVYTNTVNADVEVAIKAAKVTLKGGQVSGKTRDDITDVIGEYPIIKHKTDKNNNDVEPDGVLTLTKNKAVVEKDIDVVIVKGPETANRVSRIEYGKAAINTKDGFTAIDKRLNHEDVFKRLVSLVAEYEAWALEDLAEMLDIDTAEEDAIVKALLEKTLTGVYDFTLETDNAALRLFDPTNNDGRLINFWARGDLHIFARDTL